VDQSLRDAGERAPPAQARDDPLTRAETNPRLDQNGAARAYSTAAEPWRACSPARAVANVVTDLVDAWDDQEKPARLARVNVVHGHRLAGNELPTERSSKPVAFAFACWQQCWFCLEAAARNRRAAPGKNGSYVIVGEDACFACPSGVASA
jgi:hypothetical protein